MPLVVSTDGVVTRFGLPGSVGGRLAVLLGVCLVIALPSLVWGLIGEYDLCAMLAGIGCVAAVLTVLSFTRAAETLMRSPRARQAVLIGFGVRMACSLVLPVGMTADFVPGVVSILTADWLGFGDDGFASTFLITVAQGAAIGAVLAAFVLIVYAVMRAIRLPVPAATPVCLSCGYDLRGLPDHRVCPECGSARRV